MKTKRWLVYYKQRRIGTETWIEANGLTDQHPADFLLHLVQKYEDHESMVMWAIEVPNEDTAARLAGRL